MGKMIESGLEFNSIHMYDISDQRLIRTDCVKSIYFITVNCIVCYVSGSELSDIICTNY